MSTTIDAVLPLRAVDLRRFELLADSLAARAPNLIGRLVVVSPSADRLVVERTIGARARPFELALFTDEDVAPELAWAVRMPGWYRQQLVKLAAAAHVRSELYLTLDADVICTRALQAEDLAPSGRGLVSVVPGVRKDRWYAWAEAVHGLPVADKSRLHNVTPALLHRGGVAALAAHLGRRFLSGPRSSGWRGVKQRALRARWALGRPASFDPFRLHLVASVRWTEYALYYSYLESAGLFDRYHELSAVGLYDADRSVWAATEQGTLATWDPAPLFEGRGPPWFAVVQSNTQVPVEQVRAKVAPWVPG